MAGAESVANPITEEGEWESHSLYRRRCESVDIFCRAPTHVDVQELLRQESSGEGEGWKRINKTENVEVWSKGAEGSPMKITKVSTCSLNHHLAVLSARAIMHLAFSHSQGFLTLPGVPKEAGMA